MKHWFRALQEYPNDSIRDYLTFIFLTGCRRTESVILQWSWVDLEHGIVSFPGTITKNGNDLVLPLCGYLWHLLKERRTRNDADPLWVFPGGTATQKTGKHLSNQLKCCDKIFQKSGVDWSVHDLRRTYATVALKCVSSDIIVKRLINHSTGNDVTAGYVCLDPEDLRPHVDKIAATILEYSGYRFIPQVGLVKLENVQQVEATIQEGALINALKKLDPKTLKEIARTFDRPQTMRLVVGSHT
ncbi:MAG: tyrosine-type recombinase/integrase [Candidatus Obscuribacter sp.]|nr:tyrosine-type recombinase/integrase [Candidatus Obscuribacter sp.]